MRIAKLRDELETALWVAPTIGAAGALLLAVVLLGVDRTLSQEHAAWYLFDGARMPRITCSRSSRPRC